MSPPRSRRRDPRGPRVRPGRTRRGGPRTGTRTARWAADDRAVSPVIAHILIFAITSSFLVVVTITSSETLDEQHRDAARVQFEDLAQRMANAVEEAFYVVDSNPDANYTKRLPLPRDVRGFEYRIDVNETMVHVNATTGRIQASTPLHNPNEHCVDGDLQRRTAARVTHELGVVCDPANPAKKTIRIGGGD